VGRGMGLASIDHVMTLRARLFLIFGGLLALIVIGQWLLVGALTRQLASEVDQVAVAVGRDLLSQTAHDSLVQLNSTSRTASQTVVHRFSREQTGQAGAAGPPAVSAETELVEGKDLEAGDLIPRIMEGTAERSGRKVAVLEVDEGDGTTWVQEVVRLEPTTVDVRGDLLGSQDATAIFTYQISVNRPGDRPSLSILGPDGGRMIPIPTVGVNRAVEQISQNLLIGMAVILVVGLLIAALVAHRVSAPLRGLAMAARTVGAGSFGTLAPEQGSGEVRDAIVSFNRMSSHLRDLSETAQRLRAREHLTELGEVARGLAHTLRNPLNALGLSLEELAGQARDPEQADELVIGARRQIRRVDDALRSFLALASEKGGHAEEVDLLALLQDVALEASQDTSRSVHMKVQASSDNLRLKAVAPELRAVVQALVVNAVEASPDGGHVTARVRRVEAPLVACLEIEDDGPGLPDEVRSRLFTPHVTTKATGSGMGLYLAQRIASTRYGGKVSLQDRPQGGTLVVLELGHREENDSD
jgi:signal transduction histidine kinase